MIEKEEIVNTRFTILLGVIITLTTITIPILISDSESQQEQGITPVVSQNVSNQTLQDYPTEDKDMSTGLENKNQ